jgi:hypothetical protein
MTNDHESEQNLTISAIIRGDIPPISGGTTYQNSFVTNTFLREKGNVIVCPFARLNLSCAKRAGKIQNPEKWNKLQAKTK